MEIKTMTVLSAQSIRKLCLDSIQNGGTPLIFPFTEAKHINGRSVGLSACTYDCRVAGNHELPPHKSILVSTQEHFILPHNICGSVLDKSSLARLFISAFNTHLDPGWRGYLTVELTNLGEDNLIIKAGDALCQIKFEWLDEPTDLPYTGKYQEQEPGPQPAR